MIGKRRSYFFRLAFVLLLAPLASAYAQEAPATILLLRTTATDRGAFHYAEVIHERGRLVPLDIGYIDFNHASTSRTMWIGGGFKPIATSRVSLTAEGYAARVFGTGGQQALYFMPFFIGSVRLTQHVAGESEYFAYVPLNAAGHAQHVLERAKVEYDFRHGKLGGGYSAYNSAATPWQHKPFITTTIKVPQVGNVEFWLQRLPDKHLTLQIRYAKVFTR